MLDIVTLIGYKQGTSRYADSLLAADGRRSPDSKMDETCMADDASKPRRLPAALKARNRPKPALARWTRLFLSELAATSNVSASARKAGVSTTTVYDTRRQNPDFNRAWQQALCEGYEHLEMELLHRLRNGEMKPAGSAKRGARSFDNATAFRLLAAHREAAARQKAVRGNEDAEAIVLSINAKLEKMRQRMLAPPVTIDASADDLS